MFRTALVIGATGGIGKATALRLAMDGFGIAVHYHSDAKKEEAEKIARECRNHGAPVCFFVCGDVSDRQVCRNIIDEVNNNIGIPDVIVNCAGIVRFGPFEKITEKCFREVMAVNFESVFFIMQAIVPFMKKKRYGRIINITSLISRKGSSGLSSYTASKAAVEGLTVSTAAELGQFGITVNCISPGFVKTSWSDRLTAGTIADEEKKIPLRRFARPENIASSVSFLASEDAEYITGKVIEVTGGL